MSERLRRRKAQSHPYGLSTIITASVGFALAGISAANAAPPIRISAANPMPACATPQTLDAFLSDQIRRRGYVLTKNHRAIAKWYKHHGERHRVRWDYAFFQMALETNFLSFRRANGQRGDVHPRQNNFAGLGTTGGGVPGDSYPNASTGVLAQIQHLVVYSGERLRAPVGHRTRLKQDVILRSTRKIVRRRPVTFADLARRWAADPKYGRSINRIARLFYDNYCDTPAAVALTSAPQATIPRPTDKSASQVFRRGQTDEQATPGRSPAVPKPLRARSPAKLAARTATPARPHRKLPEPKRLSALAPKLQLARPSPSPTKHCEIKSASYGGTRAVLIESTEKGVRHLTALVVQPGFEAEMAKNFIASYAQTGRMIGIFDTASDALARARSLCTAKPTK